ncbi:M23 family metallopeptidase [Clostridiaceae bacterium M8S5]|nr:M23 family metallopeptidase [Clostridiaceae bacterium M8S5]
MNTNRFALNKSNKKRNNYYYKRNNKSFYQSQLKKIIICIIIVLCVIFLKKIDTNHTKRAAEFIDKTVSENYDVKSNGKKFLEFLKSLVGKGSKEKSTDSTIISDASRPIVGKVYRRFGKVRKSKDIYINSKGLDIKPLKKDVICIADGVVQNVGNERNRGYFVIINHKGIKSKYQNLDKVFIKEGQRLNKDYKIGEISLSKMLHFEIWENKVAVDPLEKLYNNKY